MLIFPLIAEKVPPMAVILMLLSESEKPMLPFSACMTPLLVRFRFVSADCVPIFIELPAEISPVFDMYPEPETRFISWSAFINA